MENAIVWAKQAALTRQARWGFRVTLAFTPRGLDLRKTLVFYPWGFVGTKTDFPGGKTFQ